MCEHHNFKTTITVTRLTDEDNGPVRSFAADIRISCADCGLPFEFMGLPMGYSDARPMVSIDATELCAPIRPSTDPVEQIKTLLQ